MFTSDDAAFLATIGCTRQELFDFVDDLLRYGEPDFDTALAVQSIRRDYFLGVLGGQSTGRTVAMDDLPPKAAMVDGIAWLPRLIVKARLKLRGEMPSDLMYCCGGDRSFLRRVKMTAPDFLALVRDSGQDDRRVIDAVQSDGTCWCGPTVWHGQTAMRVSVINWSTTEHDVDRSLDAILRLARANGARPND